MFNIIIILLLKYLPLSYLYTVCSTSTCSAVEQVLGALEAESCDQLELDKIKAAVAAELNVDPSQIVITCQGAGRRQVVEKDQSVQSKSVHPTVVIRVSVNDGNRKRLLDLMGNVNQFVSQLNTKLSGEANDFEFANKPSNKP